MKRITSLALCCILLLALAGCASRGPALTSGDYYVTGDYEHWARPFLYLDTQEKTFILGAGYALPYGERGSYEIKDGILTAVSEAGTLTFAIQDDQTLVLHGSVQNEYIQLAENSTFVFSEEIL